MCCLYIYVYLSGVFLFNDKWRDSICNFRSEMFSSCSLFMLLLMSLCLIFYNFIKKVMNT